MTESLNVERELVAIKRRVQAQIDASAREALIRIGVDPDEFEREEAARRREELLRPFVELGRSVRELVDIWAAVFGAFDRGFQRRVDVVPLTEFEDGVR